MDALLTAIRRVRVIFAPTPGAGRLQQHSDRVAQILPEHNRLKCGLTAILDGRFGSDGAKRHNDRLNGSVQNGSDCAQNEEGVDNGLGHHPVLIFRLDNQVV